MQKIIMSDENYTELMKCMQDLASKKIFVVCGNSIKKLRIYEYLKGIKDNLGIEIVWFSDFQPNPTYESVVKGITLFQEEQCDLIFAIGGGSAIDVAKCVKLFSNMPRGVDYIHQEIIPNNIPLIAMPTTSGSGSEATRFAVIYYQNEKQSISHVSCIPSIVVMDADALKSVPDYHKKATMLDALCHAIESFWSVNSNEESKEYSRKAIKLVLENKDSYLENTDEGNAAMLQASNYAGRAINITQTTAGHAMCYKMTTLYKLAHGHAVALCVLKLWPYMIKHTQDCNDLRGKEYLDSVFAEIAELMGAKEPMDAVVIFRNLVKSLELNVPVLEKGQLEVLCGSVNPVRLKNNPVILSDEAINELYGQIMGKEQKL